MNFCQPRIIFDRLNLEPIGENLRGLSGTVQRTGVNRADPCAAQPTGKVRTLHDPNRAEWRIALSLIAAI